MSRFTSTISQLAAVLLLGTAALFAQQACPTPDAPLPVIFVHGNGDDATKWTGIIWLFESNGYPGNKLFAIRFPMPVARTNDTVEEPFRSSTEDSAAELSSYVTRVLLETQSRQVVLVGSSRGGLTIRNYVQNGGGRHNVACAILSGTPNHGVLTKDSDLDSEFNAKGHFLQALNRTESIVGLPFLTLRSDRLDKFAQPTGIAFGAPQMQTGISFDAPSLAGATNLVLAGLDHRELAFHPAAFAEMYKFVTGNAPHTLEVATAPRPVVSGLVTGFSAKAPTNLPLAGARLRIYAIDSHAETSKAILVYEVTTGMDGKWGPFTASSTQEYAFDLEYQGRNVRYYKAPLLRSTQRMNLRFLPVPAASSPDSAGQQKQTAKLLIMRPEGYLTRDRDPVQIDGKTVPEELSGLPVQDSLIVNLATPEAVQVALRKERITARPSYDLARELPVVEFLW